MDVTIRELSHADVAQWLPLWDGYLRFYEIDPATVTTDSTWRRLLDGETPMSGIVAVRGG